MRACAWVNLHMCRSPCLPMEAGAWTGHQVLLRDRLNARYLMNVTVLSYGTGTHSQFLVARPNAVNEPVE